MYAFPADIDWSRINGIFRDLIFFADDTSLAMQGMNVAVVDELVTGMEYDLLREHREIERTPLASGTLVSALSQMWIFALYELLRTWHQRIRDFRKQHENGMLASRVLQLETRGKEAHSAAALMQADQARQVLENPSLLDIADAHWSAIKLVYDDVELIRINLAKHEAPGSKLVPRSPGYSRINPFCGALDFTVTTRDHSETMLNRRDIADALRRVSVQPV